MTAAPVTMRDTETGPASPSPLRVVLVVTGASSAAYVPYWVNWIGAERPHTRLRILVSTQATRFVTPASLHSALVDEVIVDTWDSADDRALHVELAGWADAMLVYPASQNYLAALAADAADRPSLLALQLTRAPIVIAPSVAPGGLESGGFRRSWSRLDERPGVALLPPVPGTSRHRADLTAWVPAPMPEAFDRMDRLRASTVNEPSRYGTRLLRTEIEAAGPVWTWTRTPGRDAPRSFTASDDPVLEKLTSARLDGIALGVPSSDRLGRRYRIAGQRSMASLLLETGPADPLLRSLERMGATLAAVHDVPLPSAAVAAPSRGLVRLAQWLEGVDQPPVMLSARQELLARDASVALAAVDVLDDLERRALRAPVVCHGAPGLGSAVPDGRTGVVLLTGEDVHVGSRESDLMWVLGELLEFSFTRQDDPRAWGGVVDAFLAGYGREPGISLRLLAAARILLHLHDYIAYVGWSASEFHRYGGMLRYLTDTEVVA